MKNIWVATTQIPIEPSSSAVSLLPIQSIFSHFLEGNLSKFHHMHQVWSPPKAGQLTIILILPCDFGGFWAWNCLTSPPPPQPKKCPISWRYLSSSHPSGMQLGPTDLPVERIHWDSQHHGFQPWIPVGRWLTNWRPEVKKRLDFFKNEWKMAPKNDLKMFFWKFWSFFSCCKL